MILFFHSEPAYQTLESSSSIFANEFHSIRKLDKEENPYSECLISHCSPKEIVHGVIGDEESLIDILVCNESLLLLSRDKNCVNLNALARRAEKENTRLQSDRYLTSHIYTIDNTNLNKDRKFCAAIVSACLFKTSASSQCLKINEDLFSLLFGIEETIQDRIVFLFGIPNGEVHALSFSESLLHVPKNDVGGYNASEGNFCAPKYQTFCDLSEPVESFHVIKAQEFKIDSLLGLSVDDNPLYEDIQKEFLNESVLTVVGKFGKVVIYLRHGRKCESSLVNWVQIPSPILCSMALESLFVCSTRDTILIYQLVIEIKPKVRSAVSVIPDFNLLLSIPSASFIKLQNCPKLGSFAQETSILGISFEGSLHEILLTTKLSKVDKPNILPTSSGVETQKSLKTLDDAQKDYLCREYKVRSQLDALVNLQRNARILVCISHVTNPLCLNAAKTLPVSCDITDIVFNKENAICIGFKLKNNTEYSITDQLIVCCTISSQNTIRYDSQHGDKSLRSSFSCDSLQEKATRFYSLTFANVDLQTFLPLTLEFSLILVKWEFCTRSLPLGLVLRLNNHDVTILDLCPTDSQICSRDLPCKLCSLDASVLCYCPGSFQEDVSCYLENRRCEIWRLLPPYDFLKKNFLNNFLLRNEQKIRHFSSNSMPASRSPVAWCFDRDSSRSNVCINFQWARDFVREICIDLGERASQAGIGIRSILLSVLCKAHATLCKKSLVSIDEIKICVSHRNSRNCDEKRKPPKV